MTKNEYPIGFFDSGIGGISVLRQAVKLLPKENFVYLGDSRNAPYGKRSTEDVRELTLIGANILYKRGIKAIVIACNTATSAAIEDLRKRYLNIPVIGIEPAIKPAVKLKKIGKIIIMATAVTINEIKFNNLCKKYSDEADILPLPCPGLVELIEDGKYISDEVFTYLKEKLLPYSKAPISSIVLGCTHYPFIIKELSEVLISFQMIPKVIVNGIIEDKEKLSNEVFIIDGSIGTAKQLKKKLTEASILNISRIKGKVEIINTLGEGRAYELCKLLLKEILI
ncbi:MAG TPA: glutamate racemase [Clostridiaceae bacterium]